MSALKPFPVLKTSRRLLREMEDHDVEGYARLLSDKDSYLFHRQL
jgi:hypothetical protein